MLKKIVDKNGNAARLNDHRRTLLRQMDAERAARICAELNAYPSARAGLAPFTVEDDPHDTALDPDRVYLDEGIDGED